MAKRLLVAYGLWALGGPLGLHHVYLGRDSHALLWLVTLGGFGAGWLCDLPRLPAWVAAANGARPRPRGGDPAPSPSALRFAAQLAAGTYMGTLVGLAVPWAPAVPLGAALGVQLAAADGHRVPAVPVLGAAGLAALLCGARALPTSLAATAAARQLRRCGEPVGPERPGRLCRLALGYAALGATLAAAVLGPVGAALLRLSQGGLVGAALHWARGDGPDARLRRAYEVLGLSAGCSAEDVHRSYRELVKLWHPDHNRQRAAEAERRFIELHEAYEVLVGPRRAAAAA
ncbi:dnaJ homolog subfamily C member 22 [Eudromia elegans]